MKILVTGRAITKQPDRCTGQQLALGFREAGHECLFYGCFYGQPYHFLGAKEVQSEDFDLIVVTEMNDGMPGYETLFGYHKLRNTPRIYWDFDVSYHPAVSYRRASLIEYDGYLVGNKRFISREEFGRFGKPVLHLPYACSPTIHRRKPDVLKQFVVGFVGNITPERQALLEMVKCFRDVFGESLIDATNQLYNMIHINQDACRGLVPGRPWETAGCGTNLIMDQASYDDFAAFLSPDVLDAVTPFKSEQELTNIIKNCEFPGPDVLAEMRSRGEKLMRYVHQNHSYRNRAESIIEWAKENKIL